MKSKEQTQSKKIAVSWVVFLSAMIMAIMMAAQYFTQAVLPITAMGWVYAAIVSGYTATDRKAQHSKTKTLGYGKADVGNNGKLKSIIITTVLLLLEGIGLTVLFGLDLNLDALVAAFGGTGTAFVVGNKMIKSAAFTEGDKSEGDNVTFFSGGPNAIKQ